MNEKWKPLIGYEEYKDSNLKELILRFFRIYPNKTNSQVGRKLKLDPTTIRRIRNKTN